MLHLDTMIRGATGDEHCLDDVVVGLIDESKKGHEPTWEGFLAAADALVDGRATEKGMQVQKSGPLLPPENYFGENYILVDCGVLQEDNGFDDTVRYANPRVVTGLKPDSNAAKAGLKDGDLLLSFPVESNLYKSETIAAQYKVKRGTQELEISYVPRGKRVSCWQNRKREK